MPSTIGELRGIKGDMEIEWIINDFSIFSAVIDTKYMSPSFDFAGASWSLWIFPNGTTEYNSEGKVECYLVKITGPSITLSYILGLKKGDGNFDEKCKQTTTFEEIEGGFGCLQIISTSELLKRKSDLAPNNVLTIICKITGEKVNIDSRFYRLNHLSDCLRILMETGIDSDLTVKLKEKEYKLHKNILRIRSPTFANKVIKEIEENMLDFVYIDDYEEVVFKMFLEYIYTGEVKELSQQNICQLYEMAKDYEVAELRADCLKCIKDTLSIGTFFDVIKIAEKYEEKELISLTSIFCSNNLKDLVQSSQWLSFMQENTKTAYELLSTALKNYVKA